MNAHELPSWQPVGRPGTGGRPPRATPFTASGATEELIAELGHPHVEFSGGVELLSWTVHADGDGIEFARLSGPELQGGETAIQQIHEQRPLRAAALLRPRLIVVTVHNSGTRRFRDRPDLQLVCAAVTAGWCRWISFRNPDRIARKILPAEQLYEFLQEHRIDLYLSSLGRRVDWRRDSVYLRTLGIVSAEELENIKERTHGAIMSRYPHSGRGWPGTKPFGFRRNWATKFLEVDPEQWEFVERIHYRYAKVEDGSGRGCAALSRDLARAGCQLSSEQIRTILDNEIYVTGRYSVTVNGEKILQRPIDIPRPIPAHVQQGNRELLRLRRGAEVRTRAHDFCLNAVNVEHQRCAGQTNGRGRRTRLRARHHPNNDEPRYRHMPWVPAGCRGWSVPQAILEAPVLKELCDLLASSPELMLAFEQASRACGGAAEVPLPDEQRRALRRRLRQRETQQAQLTRRYLERVDGGDPLNEKTHADLVAAVTLEIEQLKYRLATTPMPAEPPEASSSLREALTALLAPGVPADLERARRRAALVAAALRRVIVSDTDAGIAVELHCPLAHNC